MKAYVKPELFYESFELSQHIALCAWDMNSQDVYNCSADGDKKGPEFCVPHDNIFVMGGICQTVVNPEDYCYTNGNQMMSIFNS